MVYWNRPTTTFGAGYSPVRTTTLVPPLSWSPYKTYPLMLILANYASTGVSVTARLDLAKANNFDDGCLILAPDGRDDPINPGSLYYDYWTPGSTDLVQVVQMVNDVIAAGWKVDTKRIWVLGYSNGGGMCHSLSIVNSTLFTAGMSFSASGLLADSTSPTTKAVPWVHFHGSSDITWTFAGDVNAAQLPGSLATHGFVSATADTAAHASRNGLGGTLQTAYDTIDMLTTGTPSGAGAECARQAYSGTTGENAVELWVSNAVPHTISVSVGRGNDTIWKWLQDHHRTT